MRPKLNKLPGETAGRGRDGTGRSKRSRGNSGQAEEGAISTLGLITDTEAIAIAE
jgi:hypothetical protein